MIRCENGKTQIQGTTLEIIQDFANIVAAMRTTLHDGFTDESTDELIALCGQLGYADADNDKEKIAPLVKQIGDVLVHDSK